MKKLPLYSRSAKGSSTSINGISAGFKLNPVISERVEDKKAGETVAQTPSIANMANGGGRATGVDRDNAVSPTDQPLLHTVENGPAAITDSSVNSLLEKAQQFSMFTVRHVEEVRRELLLTADSRFLVNGNDGSSHSNKFGGVNGADIASAFDELSTAYERLSLMKWDAVRKEYEDLCRTKVMSQMQGGHDSSMGSDLKMNDVMAQQTLRHLGDEVAMNVSAQVPVGSERLMDDNPWHGSGASTPLGGLEPHDWIAAAFSHNGAFAATETSDKVGNSFPLDRNLSSLSLDMGTSAVDATWAAATPVPPPGFGTASLQENLAEDAVEKDEDSAARGSYKFEDKETTQSTSIPSEISSLHTSSHPLSDEASSTNQDVESDVSSTSESSQIQDIPSLAPENFDYVYQGGYAMRVSDGKENQGVVPRKVKHVLVDSSVRYIEDGAFQGCNALESVTIPPSVVSIGDHAFRKCSSLKSVVFIVNLIASNGRGKDKRFTKKCRSELTNGDKKSDKRSNSRRLSSRESSSSISSISGIRPSNLRSIGDWAFFNCSALTTLVLPNGVEQIGTRAFQRCSSLLISDLPRSLKAVGDNAFYGCPLETKKALERWENAEKN